MLRRILMTILGAGGLGLLTLPLASARAEPPVEETSGVEVQARGPVHEAFAQPTEDQPQPGPIVAREPPPALDELPPDQKPDGANVRWIAGYWQWDDERRDYLWVSGFWRDVPPGRQWVPGGYRQVGDGWQWVPGFWAEAGQSEMTYVPPPPQPPDVGPSTPAPDDTSTYVPGVWVYVEARYRWRPGFWLGHRRGWIWQPAHYVRTPSGCLFVDGYWDYPLEDRGLCFAPVYVPQDVYGTPGFVYRPYYVVSADFLPGALFVRGGGYGHYYFGDYYGSRYARSYTPFIDARIGRSASDPLFNYYRSSRGPGWEREVRGLYAGRAAGDVVLPPRTLVQQNTLIRSIDPRRTNVRNVTVVQPLPRAATAQRALTAVSSAERTQARQEAVQVRQVTRQRIDQERRLAPVRTNDPPRSVRLELPKQAEVRSNRPAPQPPPRPTGNVQSQVRTETRTEPRHQDPPPVKHQDPPKKVEPPPVKHQDPPVQSKVTTPVTPKHEPPPQSKHQDPPQHRVTTPAAQPRVAAAAPRSQPRVTTRAPAPPKPTPPAPKKPAPARTPPKH
jgi:hypothetical protein